MTVMEVMKQAVDDSDAALPNKQRERWCILLPPWVRVFGKLLCA
jgi:hypothetical protein